jgi:hypothetical protein
VVVGAPPVAGVKTLAAAVVVAVLAGGCGGDKPEPKAEPVVTLVPAPASRYSGVTATGPSGTVELTGELLDAAVPVRASRSFSRRLVEYGLEPPQGELHYPSARGGPQIDLRIGGPTFDSRGVYVSRAGDDRVYLVFVDRLRPVFAAAGISIPDETPRELPPA